MGHFVAVGVGDSVGDLCPELGGPCRRQWSFCLEDLGEGGPVHPLHHDEGIVTIDARVEDGHDVGVVELACGPGLGAEALHEGGVAGELGPQHLGRHRAAEREVVGFVDVGHPSARHVAAKLVAAREDAIHGGSLGVR